MKRRTPGNPAIKEKIAKLKQAMDAIANMSQEEREAMLQRLGAVVTCEGHAWSLSEILCKRHSNDRY